MKNILYQMKTSPVHQTQLIQVQMNVLHWILQVMFQNKTSSPLRSNHFHLSQSVLAHRFFRSTGLIEIKLLPIYGKLGHQDYALRYIKWLSSVFVITLLKSLENKKLQGFSN